MRAHREAQTRAQAKMEAEARAEVETLVVAAATTTLSVERPSRHHGHARPKGLTILVDEVDGLVATYLITSSVDLSWSLVNVLVTRFLYPTQKFSTS